MRVCVESDDPIVPTQKLTGIDIENLDQTVDPATDFYRYATERKLSDLYALAMDMNRRNQFLYAAQRRVCTWNTRMRTLGKHVLQIQIEVFHTVAATTEHGEDGPYNLAL